MASPSFEKYLSEQRTGLKELNNLLSSRITTIRSERNKRIHTFFHTELLPLIETVDKKSFHTLMRYLSKLYRNPTFDVDEYLEEIRKSVLQMTNNKHTGQPKVETVAEKEENTTERAERVVDEHMEIIEKILSLINRKPTE